MILPVNFRKFRTYSTIKVTEPQGMELNKGMIQFDLVLHSEGIIRGEYCGYSNLALMTCHVLS